MSTEKVSAAQRQEFQPSLIFATKAGTYLSECLACIVSPLSLAHKYMKKLEIMGQHFFRIILDNTDNN
jgi:hypothetical protein